MRYLFIHYNNFQDSLEAVKNWVWEMERLTDRPSKEVNRKIKNRIEEFYMFCSMNPALYKLRNEFWKGFPYFLRTNPNYQHIKCEWHDNELRGNTEEYVEEWRQHLLEIRKNYEEQRMSYQQHLKISHQRQKGEKYRDFKIRVQRQLHDHEIRELVSHKFDRIIRENMDSEYKQMTAMRAIQNLIIDKINKQ